MTPTTEQIKELREKTGVSMMQCRQAIIDANGDMAKALEVLMAESAKIAEKKSERALKAGTVAAYVHAGGSVGALVRLQCETDFVARNPEFKALAEDLAMQVAAMAPADTAELLQQPFIKDPNYTVSDMVKQAVQKFGENTDIESFSRLG